MENRIKVLDGFRVVAITVVMLFHYYFLYESDKYSITYNLRPFFRFGYLGVELFFIISGFVISLTLTKCQNFSEFAKKRIVRLLPAMVICSIITFAFFSIFDTTNLFADSHSYANLLISNTFINPELINVIFHTHLNYVDGSYWSLWVEVNFYIIFGIIYFFSPKKAVRNYMIFAILGIICWKLFENVTTLLVLQNLFGKNVLLIHEYIKCFRILEMGIWFLLGILLYELHKSKKVGTFILFTIFFIFQSIAIFNKGTLIFSVIVYSLLISFVYFPNCISSFGGKYISKIGVASYSIYLIHQNIGVFLIYKFTPLFGQYNFILPIVIILFLFQLGVLNYQFVEKPLGNKLRNIILRNKQKI